MRRTRALEGGREYTCLVFTNAQQPRTWSIGTSLPPVNKKAEQALRAATHVFSTRVKALNVNMLKPSDPSAKRYMWAEPSLGGESYYPRVERSLTVKGGDSREPGRLSGRADDHDVLRSIGESNSLQYNTVPEVTVLDTKDRHFYRINWHLAHELPATTFWEVGFFVRQYTSKATKKIGFTLVLESLVGHGKAISDDITSPIPRKRKVDYFTDGNDDSRKKVGSAS
ncbi:hypothetical protein A4X13_0g7152 [Tilletia indica]|uniref:Uncharacterized protein n=1 Tax=Tilletia indica TaxID=43049 RepID=A0A177TB18_9BASI|nr:hypothetical protein A4X13_0g7152 [Tilletia indica]